MSTPSTITSASPANTDSPAGCADGSVGGIVRNRSSPRSRNGCWTCRSKAAKKRCDEAKPVCGRCARVGLACDYSVRPKPKPRPRRVLSAASASVPAGTSSSSMSMSTPTVYALATSSPSLSPLLLSPASPSLTRTAIPLDAPHHEALRYFRTTFAAYHHTKHPAYGCISIMFELARDSAMVMHMALALGFHEMDARRQRRIEGGGRLDITAVGGSNSSLTSTDSRPTQHYAAALRLLASVVGDTSPSTQVAQTHTPPAKSLDACLSTLWLMLLYEQQFGDAEGRGLAHHLRGAALLAQHKAVASSSSLSLYTVRMLVWIAHIDAAAAAAGLGGFFHKGLIKSLQAATEQSRTIEGATSRTLSETASPDIVGEDGESDDDSLDLLVRMHSYSNPLYRTTWAAAYPQAELLDDLANRSVFHLFTCCGPLRRSVSRLAGLEGTQFDRERVRVALAINKVRLAFGDVLDVARALSMDASGNGDASTGQPRLVANLRIVVPTFYAVEIEFARIVAGPQTRLPLSTTEILSEILRLAFQTHKQGGDAALTRIAWPLFVSALETSDPLHRQWILDRFEGMAVLGDHLQRAHRLLVDAVALQEKTGQMADVRSMMPSYGAIVLT